MRLSVHVPRPPAGIDATPMTADLRRSHAALLLYRSDGKTPLEISESRSRFNRTKRTSRPQQRHRNPSTTF